MTKYGANTIAEWIYNQVDDDGLNASLFTHIIGHQKTDDIAMSKKDFQSLEQRQTPSRARTTKGWEICVQWADGSSSRHPMTEIKNSFPKS